MSLFPIMWDFVMEERYYPGSQHGETGEANAGALAPPQPPVGDRTVPVSEVNARELAVNARELRSVVDRVSDVVAGIERAYPDVFAGVGGAV